MVVLSANLAAVASTILSRLVWIVEFIINLYSFAWTISRNFVFDFHNFPRNDEASLIFSSLVILKDLLQLAALTILLGKNNVVVIILLKFMDIEWKFMLTCPLEKCGHQNLVALGSQQEFM